MSQNIDVEDSLFISDVDEDLVINENNKRESPESTTPIPSPKKHKQENTTPVLFSKGELSINENSKYLTINEYGTVLLLTTTSSKSVHVEFLNASVANSYEFDIPNDVEIDVCSLTSTNLIFLNMEKNEITVRNHFDNEKSDTFKITGLNLDDYITAVAFDNQFYIGTKLGILIILNEFGIMTHKRVFSDEINILEIKFNKLFIIHSDYKRYSILIHNNSMKYIHSNCELPSLISHDSIKNVGISDNNTPWISTFEGFYTLINSYNEKKSYWVNALSFENEIYRMKGGFITHQDENDDEDETQSTYLRNRKYQNYYILPVNLISDYDELILGYTINSDNVKLSTIETYQTSSTPITLVELEERIKNDESLDDKDYNNLLNCEIDTKGGLQLPNYYRQVDGMLQNGIQGDAVSAAVLENSMVNEDDSVQLLKNLNNAWDSSVLRLFDIKCQQNDVKCCYSLVLTLKQLKCLDKAKEISRMYGIYELSDKINDLIDSKSGI